MLYFLENSFDKNASFFRILGEFFGLGSFQVKRCCYKFGIKATLRWAVLSNKKKAQLIDFLVKEKKQLKDKELKFYLLERKKKLVESRCFRGLRVLQGLPIRGQRTKTNKKTARKLNKNLARF